MKKVITFGVFDYFHLGHLRLFQNAKRLGDYLIVAVQDGTYIQKYKPNAKVLYTTEERMELVRALKNNRNCKRALSNSNIKQVFLAIFLIKFLAEAYWKNRTQSFQKVFVLQKTLIFIQNYIPRLSQHISGMASVFIICRRKKII